MNHLVIGPCQSRKSWKTFSLLKQLTNSTKETGVDCIFVSQANSASSVTQTLHRIKNDEGLGTLYEHFDIISKDSYDTKANKSKLGFFIGYWHERTRQNAINIIKANNNQGRARIIVIDEAEQGGAQGVQDRLHFLSSIIHACQGQPQVYIVLITATIANLSASVSRLIQKDASLFSDNAMEHLLRMPWHVHHVDVSKDYVGMQWYLEQGLVNRIKLSSDTEKRMQDVVDITSRFNNDQARLSLICVSSKQNNHEDLGTVLVNQNIFNVCICLNSSSVNSQGYLVLYTNDQGTHKWYIPMKHLNRMAASGNLASIIDTNTARLTQTHWDGKSNTLPLPFVLQACLFMGTEYQKEIKEHIANDKDWASLIALYHKIDRPQDYPTKELRICVIAGNMVNRGITLTSAQCYFVFSSYIFGDTPDGSQRGAVNAQRAGRSFGNILEACHEIRPIIYATDKVVSDALANEILVSESDDTCVDLCELVTEAQWQAAKQRAHDQAHITKQSKTKSNTSNIQVRPTKSLKYGSSIAVMTEYKCLTVVEFLNEYTNISSTQHPISLRSAPKLLAIIKSGIDANMSFTSASAGKVANMRNYYMRPEWAGKAYHIIWIEDDIDHVRVIIRNKEALDNLNCKVFAAHNEHGSLVVYEAHSSN